MDIELNSKFVFCLPLGRRRRSKMLSRPGHSIKSLQFKDALVFASYEMFKRNSLSLSQSCWLYRPASSFFPSGTGEKPKVLNGFSSVKRVLISLPHYEWGKNESRALRRERFECKKKKFTYRVPQLTLKTRVTTRSISTLGSMGIYHILP